jgi:hypothetical protein
MFKLEYMEIPYRRKLRTIKELNHCKGIFDGIEKYISAKPEVATKELTKVKGISIRYYESSLVLKQQIPRIRFRLQCNFRSRRVLVDQIAVYNHLDFEIFDDDS